MKTHALFTLLVGSAAITAAADPITGTAVDLGGPVFEKKDVSGVVAIGDLLVFAADELAAVQLLEKEDGGAKYKAREPVSLADDVTKVLANGEDAELDLEGVAADGNTIYAIGSHSKKRFKVEPGTPTTRTLAENRERLSSTSFEHNRSCLFRLELEDDGTINADSVKRISLGDFINQHAILSAFADLPSKENGVDIEGLAYKDERLWAGFRGPVLRQNWVPVVLLEFDKASAAMVRYVPLGGLGIRGMETVDDGLLLLAGPVGDSPGPYRI